MRNAELRNKWNWERAKVVVAGNAVQVSRAFAKMQAQMDAVIKAYAKMGGTLKKFGDSLIIEPKDKDKP